jgi:two-component system, OmpR family, sensor kinase
VGQRDTVRREIADGAALGAAAPILIVIPLSWLVVGWAMNRMISRLDMLARDLAARSTAAREAIPLDGVPVEVAPLLVSMNGLILRSRAALDAQRRFLADAAHELRTPLAAMQIQLDNLAGDEPDAQGRGLAALASGVRRAGALVGQLLRLARLDEPLAAASGCVDLGPLLLDCLAGAAPLAEHRGIDLGANVHAPAVTRGDAEEVRTLLANLVDNALRYTPPHGRVDVTLAPEGDRHVVEIVDTGCGIPAAEAARIFERFHRAAPDGIEGSGLGLAIAQRIAERHGFTLTVENRRDGTEGTVARVSMPSAPPS